MRLKLHKEFLKPYAIDLQYRSCHFLDLIKKESAPAYGIPWPMPGFYLMASWKQVHEEDEHCIAPMGYSFHVLSQASQGIALPQEKT
jgi:hypothetical protein